MAKSLINFLLVLAFIFLLDSCTSNKIVPANSANDPLIKKTFINLLNNQYPDSFALTQRIILNIAGTQYDFIGQLIMNRAKAYRAVLFGELGGQFIDLLAIKDSISILANPTDLPEKPIVQGVAEDIKQIYFYKNITKLNYSDLSDDSAMISVNTSEDDQLIYLINVNNYQILNLNYYSENKLIRSAEFLEYKKQDGCEWAMPSYIEVTNHRWHYSMEIHLLKCITQYNANSVFNIK